MNKKSLLGLILFASVIITGLFAGAIFLTGQNGIADTGIKSYATEETEEITERAADNQSTEDMSTEAENTTSDIDITSTETSELITATPSPVIAAAAVDSDALTATGSVADDEVNIAQQPWFSSIPKDMGAALTKETSAANSVQGPELILNKDDVDYLSYIPEMVTDSELEVALEISNPDILIDAEAAILFDANTKEVLFYKNPVQAVFPASTAKLLTSLVALQWCAETEEVTVGDEIDMIASDSTVAELDQGEVLTIRNLMEGMLLPSGNDAAYVIAAYVGRKSLGDSETTNEQAIVEFTRLMNEEAERLGVKNSCFKTPDGYDAIGQYTTAYDMGLIGIAASMNSTIIDITEEGESRNVFVSGEDVTWINTNKLVKRYSGQYYSNAIGLKTGTSTMAGRCLVAAAECDGKKVVCAIMNSTSAGRWEDAIDLLAYGLD